MEQQAAFLLASHVAHSFLDAQDAKSIEAAARMIVTERVMIVSEWLITENRLKRSINYFVTTGGGGGGGVCCWQEESTAEAAIRARIAIFIVYVGVNQFFKVPIHQTPGSGIFRD